MDRNDLLAAWSRSGLPRATLVGWLLDRVWTRETSLSVAQSVLAHLNGGE